MLHVDLKSVNPPNIPFVEIQHAFRSRPQAGIREGRKVERRTKGLSRDHLAPPLHPSVERCAFCQGTALQKGNGFCLQGIVRLESGLGCNRNRSRIHQTVTALFS